MRERTIQSYKYISKPAGLRINFLRLKIISFAHYDSHALALGKWFHLTSISCVECSFPR